METRERASDAATRQALSQELDIVRGAIELVGSGAARRVLIASLRFGDELVGPARRIAAGRGATVQPSWSADERVTGIAVVRADG